ncbi:MAG TPA: HD domain-containing protein [Acidimicrobiales bacterium]|jgi:dGTPase|nr:HD domain-containing protein [Acidimicrobiales bacterium]
MGTPDPPVIEDRHDRWASTMDGFISAGPLREAHLGSSATFASEPLRSREEREEHERRDLVVGATLSTGAGDRARPEHPDFLRTCFERDRDRILHCSAFRRLAGKTQVFVFPRDHQRTRLTHALEVAQVARSIATSLRLNVALCEAIALGHDCGHGPGGHASEDAFSPLLPGGFDHAVFGADVALANLNLTAEVRDGIRNHSWSRPAPRTPEGEVVSWADRIAYVCHDFEDALHAGVVRAEDLPDAVRRRCGSRRGEQLGAFIDGLVDASAVEGRIGMPDDLADALSAFRSFNYDRVYSRPDAMAQSDAVVAVLRRVVEHLSGGSDDPEVVRQAVATTASMTDRYAFDLATSEASFPPGKLPRGIDVEVSRER